MGFPTSSTATEKPARHRRSATPEPRSPPPRTATTRSSNTKLLSQSERGCASTAPDVDHLGDDGHRDLGRSVCPDIQADRGMDASQLLDIVPPFHHMLHHGPYSSLAPDHADVCSRAIDEELKAGLIVDVSTSDEHDVSVGVDFLLRQRRAIRTDFQSVGVGKTLLRG